ncbi:uncharacterized protein LOC118755622 [Rhagoletis pomonella]|uniref:uncharacterized protein LOC118755622 n=1 Tax=Rhagoletis pomonella TaxID=28610 RepID=UPI00177AC77B|nr:uncharacterized protein LOC118755622 [Rhagoletis pomonella]
MFRYFVYFCAVAAASAQGEGYNYASASAPEPDVYVAPPDPAPATVQIAPAQQYADNAPIAAASHHHIQQAASAPVQTAYRKDFYYFSAPSEAVVHRQVAQASEPVATVKKHLNVIVINAHESSKPHHQQPLQNTVSQSVEETKNQIYVLSKEPSRSAPSPAASQQHITTTHQSHIPEVHYVKYKTPAEALQLQQQIIQQYGGGNVVDLGKQVAASNVNRRYLAPAASNVNNQYLAPAASNVNNQYLAPAETAESAPVPSNAYIPPRFFFKL